MTTVTVLTSGSLVRIARDDSTAVPLALAPFTSGAVEFDPLAGWRFAGLVVDTGDRDPRSLAATLGLPVRTLKTGIRDGTLEIRSESLERHFLSLARTRWANSWSRNVLPEPRRTLSLVAPYGQSGARWPAYEALVESLDYMLELLDWASDRALPAVLASNLVALGDLALDLLGPRHPAHRNLRRVVGLLRSASGHRITPIDIVQTPSLVGALRGGSAVVSASSLCVAAADPAGAFAKTMLHTPVEEELDWHHVSPAVSAQIGDRFSWVRSAGEVRVEAPGSLEEASASLTARVGDAQDGVVRADARCISSPRGISARVPIPDRMGPRIAVDLAETGVSTSISTGRNKEIRASERRAILAVQLREIQNTRRTMGASVTEEWLLYVKGLLGEAQRLCPRADPRRISLRSATTSDPMTASTRPAVPPTLSELLAVAEEQGWNPP